MEQVTERPSLPKTLKLSKLKQLSIADMLKIDLDTLNSVDTKVLHQYAESADNLVEQMSYDMQHTSFDIVMTADNIQICKNAQSLFNNSQMDINAKIATSLVIANKVFVDMSNTKVGDVYTLSIVNYNHLLMALSTTFRGNVSIAAVLTQVFTVFNEVSPKIHEMQTNIQQLSTIYNAAADIVSQREHATTQSEQVDAAITE